MDQQPKANSENRSSHDWLTTYRRRIVEELASVRSMEARWSWARLATFSAAAIAWYPLRESPLLAAMSVVMLLAVFGHAVGHHKIARRKREFSERLLTVTDESLQRCHGDVVLIRSWQRPESDGEEQVVPPPISDCGPAWALRDQELDDLDLYAPPVGMFGLLNRTSTKFGAQRLSQVLDNPLLDARSISARQNAVRWLDENPESRLRLLAAAAMLRGQDKYLSALRSAINDAQPLPLTPAVIWPLKVWSLLTFSFSILALARILNAQYHWVFGLIAVGLFNGAIYLRLAGALKSAIKPWRALSKVAKQYLDSATIGAADLPDDERFCGLRTHFEAVSAAPVLPALCRRLEWTEAGGFFHVASNVLLFYDLHVATAVLGRVLPHREALSQGLSALAELEMLCSLACFANEQPLTCYPELTDEPVVEIQSGVHPLIPPPAVPNGLKLSPDHRTWIITGSNMAGKSTFLRMVGVNLLLAQIGCVAVARRMIWSPVRLITDLRIRDDLAKDESYYLAEVRQLRRMVLSHDEQQPILGLIDEPFRGTNSQERVAASVALVEHLLASPDFFLLATHEQILTTLTNGQQAANYHFQEELGKEREVFNYRLHPGPASRRNALRILEREGYPASLIARAQQWVKDNDEAPAEPEKSRG